MKVFPLDYSIIMDQVDLDGGSGGGAPEFSSLIPEGYAEKGWMKGVDSMDALFSKMDGAQNLIGQRNFIPNGDAAPEQINSFYEKLRPESHDQYAFQEIEDMPDNLKRTPESETKIKEIFHKAGVSKHQAGILQKEYDTFLRDMFQQAQDARDEQLNREFEELTNKEFGDSRDVVLKNAQDLW